MKTRFESVPQSHVCETNFLPKCERRNVSVCVPSKILCILGHQRKLASTSLQWWWIRIDWWCASTGLFNKFASRQVCIVIRQNSGCVLLQFALSREKESSATAADNKNTARERRMHTHEKLTWNKLFLLIALGEAFFIVVTGPLFAKRTRTPLVQFHKRIPSLYLRI